MNSSRNVDLPEVLVREILLRLPVKALLRFKCVCKDWCALIGNRRFIDDHFGHDSNPVSTLFQPTFNLHGTDHFAIFPDERHREAANYISQIAPVYIFDVFLGPANGVFCVVRSQWKRAALFNPATRTFKPLPPIPNLDFCFLKFGFGFDSYSGDFKVVLLGGKRKFECFFYVYNSSSDSWRKAEFVDSLNERIHAISCGNVLLNGVFHWTSMDEASACQSILAFGLRSENFYEIRVPDAIRDAKLWVYITTYGGDSIALLSRHKENKNVDFWVMRRDGLWTKSFSVALPQPYMRLLCVWSKNELLLQIGTITQIRSMTLYLFDISTKVMKIGPEKESLCGIAERRS